MDSTQQPNSIRIAQDSAAPVFRGEPANDAAFSCEQCGHVLIDSYVAEDYVSVGIQCFQCKHFSFTPESEPGEVFSVRTLALPDQRIYRINGTVTKPAGFVITSDLALQAKMATTKPADDRPPFDLSLKGLNDLVEIYTTVTGGDFDAQAKIVERSPAKFRDSLTFAWTIGTLRDRLAAGVVDLRDANTSKAIIYANMFNSMWGMWRHHPRFNLIAQGFAKPGSFLHTAGLFTTAHMMYQHNSFVGLALEDKHGEANPDLYARGAGGSRIYLEVKAPQALQNIVENDHTSVVENAVKQMVDRTKGQINKHKRGALVIFATGSRQKLIDEMHHFSENTLARVGRQRTSLAGVIAISFLHAKLTPESSGGFDYETTYRAGGIPNPHFAGENPFSFDG